MKNKKGVQINQMKRELSQLLETGQDRTARIRVEHVIREEKMVAAYDLIEIYCELIAARLPIIESQKNCPIDLKEAVTSVIFSSPRCADIPELLDVRKHFTTKYGKEFVSAAIELRPDCGVGRMLIEKLSAVAPDVQTKTKVLNAIAEEYNIKWDSKAFEENESKPPDDLLNGPNTFEKASMMHADPPKFHAAPNVQVPYSHEQERNESVNYSQQNSRSSLGTRNYASTDTGGTQTSSTASLADARPSGRGAQRMEVRQSFPRDGNDSSYGRQNWNMEFKDATAAAQAAAESAERASMAARAAAELSRQGKSTGQYSTDSRNSNFQEEGPGRYGTSDFPDEHYSRGSVNNSFGDRNPKVQDQQIDRSEYAPTEKAAERFYEDGNGRRSSQAASLRPRKDSVDDDNDNAVNTVRKVYGYSQQSSFQENSAKAEKGTFSPEMSIPEQTRTESKVELDNRQQDTFKSDNFGYYGEEMNRNRSSTSSSRSHSINSNDEYNVPKSDRPKFGNDSVEDPSVGVDHRSIYRETTKTSMYDDVADDIAFDEAESDDDGPRFDMGPQFDEVDVKSFFPSPGRESPNHSLEHTNTWSPKTIMSESVEKSGFQRQVFSERQSFSEHSEHSEKSVNPSEPDNPVPAAFNFSDGPDSGIEDEPDRTTQSHSSSVDLNHSKMNEKGARSDLESPKRGKSRFELTDLLETVSSLHSPVEEEKAVQSQQSSKLSLRDEFQDDVQVPQSSDSESGQELNLGTLPGGFRNKGYRHPPYTRNPSGNASSLSKKSIYEGSSNLEPTPTPIVMSSFNSIASRAERKESSVSHPSSGSDFNYSSLKVTEEENRKSRFEPPVGFLNHDDSDSEDDIPKENSTSRVRLGTGLSRRTKAAPSSSETSSFSRVRVEPDARPVNSASEAGRKPTRHSSSDEIPPEPRSHSSSFKQEMSKPMPDSKISRREESFKSQAAEQPSSGQAYTGPRTHSASSRQEAPRAKPESKSSKREESLKSQAVEQPSSPQRNTVEPSNSSGETSTGENSVKKASHVHPKLPDYDDIAARLQALRMNR